jgi:hypothetical protein
MRFPIDGDREKSRLQDDMYPVTKNIIKTEGLKDFEQKIPIQSIEGFSNVNF